MARKVFVNLPVKDLQRSIDFFTALGFTFNARFTDERATCMVVGDDAFVMLLVEDFFATFTPQPIADASATSEVAIALSAESREEVDELVTRALAAGGSPAKEKADDFPMYGWSFQDPDGHLWELIHMDPSAWDVPADAVPASV